MNFTLQDCFQGLHASLAFALFLLPPGYLLARCTPLLPPSCRKQPELLLWSPLLSLPVALVLCSLGPRLLPTRAISVFFLLLAALALLRAAQDARQRPPRSSNTLHHAPLLVASLLLLYTLLATSSLQIGHLLFEGVHVADWSVRIPLVADLLRSPGRPSNPFFTVAAVPQPAHFYFFWYALTAQAARLAHLPARAALTGSVFWSAASLASLLCLLLRHLAGVSLSRLRSHWIFALALCCVMGVDILPTLGGLLTHPIHLTPEIEWWHDDRIPSFLGAIVFAPHHVAGLVCSSTAFLLLVLSLHPSPANLSTSFRSLLLPTLMAGVCFAATVGVSTYLALCFASVGLLFALDQLRSRSRAGVVSLAAATLLAAILSLPILHTLLAASALPLPGFPAHRFPLSFTLRELGDGDRMVLFLSKRLHHPVHSRHLQHLLALPLVALYLPLEFGFFLIPLGLHIRHDLRRLRSPASRFTPGERTLWAMFLGALLPALFLSSAPTQGINDLGRHAGLLLRLVTVVWSARLLFPFFQRLRHRQPVAPGHPWIVRLASVLLVLGLLSQLWQVTMDRLFLPLFHLTGGNPEMPFAQDHNLGSRYFDLRSGLSQLESTLPPTAVVQGNPGSRFENITMLYSHQPFAAADPSCDIAFGGDPNLCRPMVLELQHLFGGPPDIQPRALGPYVTVTAPDATRTTTPAAFLQACRHLHLTALVAQNSDPAWSLPSSWVWHEPATFSTPHIRILRCPNS